MGIHHYTKCLWLVTVNYENGNQEAKEWTSICSAKSYYESELEKITSINITRIEKPATIKKA